MIPQKNGDYTYLIALPQYHTDTNTTTWDLSRNVSINSTQAQLDSLRTINSLRLTGKSAILNLSSSGLILNSGGLLSHGRHTITSENGRLLGVQGEAGEKTQRPFYAHIYEGRLDITGGTQIHSDYEFVKTGDGTLSINSSETHYFGRSLYINQGTLSLRQGRIQINTDNLNAISIGDFSGVDVLELPRDSWNPIIDHQGLPSIILNGTRYGPGAQYGGDEAILRMGGNTKLQLQTLHISGRGTIDWHGGEVGKANILWIEDLSFSDEAARLFMRNWYQYEDILLVRKQADPIRALRFQAIFEGYEDFPVLAIDYDANYWKITPFLAAGAEHLWSNPRRGGTGPLGLEAAAAAYSLRQENRLRGRTVALGRQAEARIGSDSRLNEESSVLACGCRGAKRSGARLPRVKGGGTQTQSGASRGGPCAF